LKHRVQKANSGPLHFLFYPQMSEPRA
jgi:hypothetical protein